MPAFGLPLGETLKAKHVGGVGLQKLELNLIPRVLGVSFGSFQVSWVGLLHDKREDDENRKRKHLREN